VSELGAGGAGRLHCLLGDHRGAAVVETLVVFPIFVAFFSMIVQLCYLEVAALGTQHAAIVAARAAIVVAADDPRYYGSGVGTLGGSRRTEVEEAAKNALRIASADPTVKLDFTGGFGQGSVVSVKATFDYHCEIPVGSLIICGTSKMRHIKREAAMPVQTAGYQYP
jgi:hypothetical protein